MSRAPGSGSRARSREIGYAEAMSEIGFLLKAEADRWQNSADQQMGRSFSAEIDNELAALGGLIEFHAQFRDIVAAHKMDGR